MIDYIKLQRLSDKVKNNTATEIEKDDYMILLYRNGSISQIQYDKYLNDKNASDTLSAAVTIGGIILLGYIIGKMVSPETKN